MRTTALLHLHHHRQRLAKQMIKGNGKKWAVVAEAERLLLVRVVAGLLQRTGWPQPVFASDGRRLN